MQDTYAFHTVHLVGLKNGVVDTANGICLRLTPLAGGQRVLRELVGAYLVPARVSPVSPSLILEGNAACASRACPMGDRARSARSATEQRWITRTRYLKYVGTKCSLVRIWFKARVQGWGFKRVGPESGLARGGCTPRQGRYPHT